jgi:hypothetical protein
LARALVGPCGPALARFFAHRAVAVATDLLFAMVTFSFAMECTSLEDLPHHIADENRLSHLVGGEVAKPCGSTTSPPIEACYLVLLEFIEQRLVLFRQLLRCHVGTGDDVTPEKLEDTLDISGVK